MKGIELLKQESWHNQVNEEDRESKKVRKSISEEREVSKPNSAAKISSKVPKQSSL